MACRETLQPPAGNAFLTSLLEISIDPKADSEQIDWLARIAGRQR